MLWAVPFSRTFLNQIKWGPASRDSTNEPRVFHPHSTLPTSNSPSSSTPQMTAVWMCSYSPSASLPFHSAWGGEPVSGSPPPMACWTFLCSQTVCRYFSSTYPPSVTNRCQLGLAFCSSAPNYMIVFHPRSSARISRDFWFLTWTFYVTSVKCRSK